MPLLFLKFSVLQSITRMYNFALRILLYFLMCLGHGSSGGKRALYHRNYCEKDVTGKVRIKCAECLDFDLCAECFSVGAEVGPHKSNHPYRVMVSSSPSN
jgi:hypothetical protein